MFDNLFNNFDDNEVIGLTDELKAIYVYNYFIKMNKSITLVTNTLYEANSFYESIKKYTDDVLFFPMDDLITSEIMAISPDLKIKRLETLFELVKDTKKIVVTNLMGFLRYLPLKENFKNSFLHLKKGIDIKDLKEKLFDLGYEKEVIINKTGEMAFRGFVTDIFPINLEDPIRIEFWGDEIDSIKYFDINTQLTIKEINEIDILPNTEFISKVGVKEKQRELIKYESVENISDYQDSTIFYINYHDICISYTNILDQVKEYEISDDTMFNLDKYKKFICLNNFEEQKIKDRDYISKEIDNFKDVKGISRLKGTIIICVSNRYNANKVMEEINAILTNENNIFENKINVIIKNINRGFVFNNYIVISERELFNKKDVDSLYKTNFRFGTRVKDISKLNVGDYIVHSVYGIGRYLGLYTLTKNNLKKDYLQIEYKDNDKLYIPVERIDLISKYSAKEGFQPRLNKLGTIEWEKTKLKARKRAHDMANELLKIYAERENSVGYAFCPDDENQLLFEKNFMYKPTIDQLKVAEEIKKDMEKNTPMDRLLCADVGYGKTEIAFRAIFKCILSGKQAMFLCPTTILSNQHFKNALERFKDFPVNIKLLNRFVTSKETTKIKDNLKEGKIDLLIGTHRVLSDDIEFKDLGLLVIDEEQRFGVKHKEKIKKYKTNIDVLTLSATPIPRTLQMSMAGIRSLSLMETPPVDRYPIETYVLEENNNIVKDAIMKELSRKGQVYILFNSVEKIEAKAKKIEKLTNSRVIYAHGKMEKNKLEDVMLKFINKEYDILLCTTIIETGIDIPNVNTLIIIDADRFGLSQLYQIRGRVGRSNKIAYCYLMYNKQKILSDIAVKRLKAIKEFTELGSGFAIAMRDLALRGAGDILGSEQAGFIDSVGVELFLKMLNEEVERLKGKEIKEEEVSEPLIDVETAINDNYVNDEELKIEIHKKISSIDSIDSLNQIKNELKDRFGKISDELDIYMHQQLFEHNANKIGIKNINQTKNFIEIRINKELLEYINGEKLFLEVLSLSRMFRFKMQGSNLLVILDTVKLDKHFIYYLNDLIEIIKKCIEK